MAFSYYNFHQVNVLNKLVTFAVHESVDDVLIRGLTWERSVMSFKRLFCTCGFSFSESSLVNRKTIVQPHAVTEKNL